MSFVRQHLIDPVSCIRCDSCRFACPNKAITKVDGTLVVDFELCDGGQACFDACDTGAVTAWRVVASADIYGKAEQASWLELPAQSAFEGGADLSAGQSAPVGPCAPGSAIKPQVGAFRDSAPALARVVSNDLVTPDAASQIHHVVLDLSGTGMVVAEGQSVGVVPPGLDETGQPHAARLYSVASSRHGEAGQKGHVAFTVKRVVEDGQGQPYRGVCSNYVCDLQPGDTVRLTGPYGATFLVPEEPDSRLLMIGTGTGIAPMRGIIEWRRHAGAASAAQLMLFYGGRTRADLAYHDDLVATCAAGEIDLVLALSRQSDQPKRYVQDALIERGRELAEFLEQPNSYIYVCGLVAMEDAVKHALETVCQDAGLDWHSILESMRSGGRFHVETY